MFSVNHFPRIEFEVFSRLCHTNVRPNHLSRIQIVEEAQGINDNLLNAHLFRVELVPEEIVDIVQFLQEGQDPEGLTEKKKKNLAIR